MLILLYVFADSWTLSVVFGFVRHSPPDLEIFHSIALLIFGRTLPRDDVGSQGREAELEDVRQGKRGYDVTDRGVNYRNPMRVLSGVSGSM